MDVIISCSLLAALPYPTLSVIVTVFVRLIHPCNCNCNCSDAAKIHKNIAENIEASHRDAMKPFFAACAYHHSLAAVEFPEERAKTFMCFTKAADEALSRAAHALAADHCRGAVDWARSLDELHLINRVVQKALTDLNRKQTTSHNFSLRRNSGPSPVSTSNSQSSPTRGGTNSCHTTAEQTGIAGEREIFTGLQQEISQKILELGSAAKTAADLADQKRQAKFSASGKSGRQIVMLNSASNNFKLSYVDSKPHKEDNPKSVTARFTDKFTFRQPRSNSYDQDLGDPDRLNGVEEEEEEDAFDQNGKENCVIM